MPTLTDKIWWDVKVYDPGSNSTTMLSKYASSEEEIKEMLIEEHGDTGWQFVRATPERTYEK